RSWKEDEGILHKYIPAAWHRMKASAITRRDVRDVLADLAKGTPIMANRVFAVLRKLFNFGVRWDLLEMSPCFGVERPAPERQRDRVLTADELRAVWKAMDGQDIYNASLFKLFLLTGQRGYELRSMSWADVDLDAGWWVVPAERAKNKLAHR